VPLESPSRMEGRRRRAGHHQVGQIHFRDASRELPSPNALTPRRPRV